jgi:uncharacterized protein (TIGR02145 family)
MAQVHNLRRQNVILTLATFAIAFSSCQRQISASFLSDKTEYDAGDIVKLTNKSTNAKTYKWTLPDGQIATSEHVDFPIALSQQDGSLTFKLEAFSKNERKTEEAIKSFIVKGQPQPDTVVTFDGYTYAIVELPNGQAWLGENLRTTVYANGDPIPNVTNATQWQASITGAWAHYKNDSQYENPYGKLYNWYTVADLRNVCPIGWHVPTDAEWSTLINYLDPNAGGGNNYPNVAGGKMKSTGTQYWLSPNTDAANESGFSGLPGGQRLYNGAFSAIANYGYWWSSTVESIGTAWFRALNSNHGSVHRSATGMASGLSVRCLRD